MFHFNVDFAVECVKSIRDNTQCVTCDKLIGPCVRFPCGHSVCEDCAQRTGECLFCTSSQSSYLVDKPQTARLNNASALLTAFQDTFNIDVYKRQRISDHLKAEKLVFPRCIQAPYKYSNKRKSSNISFSDKENISPKVFPGEEISGSDTVIMKKSVQYVQSWLNQHEPISQNLPRRPFGDINVNTQSLIQKNKRNVVKLKNMTTQVNARQSPYRKRSHKPSSLINDMVKNNLEIKNPQKHLELTKEDKSYGHKSDKNESGIVLDDELIVIEDTDSNIIDKDREAWLSVLEAAEKAECEDKDKKKAKLQNDSDKKVNHFEIYKIADPKFVDNSNKSVNSGLRLTRNVLFYKKSSLFETCKLCNHYYDTKIHSMSKVDKANDVSIVINNSEFTTTIKFTHSEEQKQRITTKNSVAIQTDKSIPLLKHEKISFDGNTTPQKRKNIINNDDVPMKMQKIDDILESLDVFATEKDIKQNFSDNSLRQHKNIIIEDSDTDSSYSCDNTHEVVVEVHRPDAPESVECGILRTLSKSEYQQKSKRQIRGHSPNSSNSSDKENLDPNRKKMLKLGKKTKNKK